MLRFLFVVAVGIYFVSCGYAQNLGLPRGLTPSEQVMLNDYQFELGRVANTTPPPFAVRSMAEWEEIQSLTVTWTDYTSTVREIVRHARKECEVIIVCSDSNSVKNNLTANGVPLQNISYLQKPFNTVWIRDYGQHSVYANDVDSLYLVEWIYNRPRPKDDVLPQAIADFKHLELFQTTTAPNDLVNTGGNFMTDGMGTAFASKLVLDENDANNNFNVTPKTEAEVNAILNSFMGINRYVKMDVLPFDGIHHIDMHMKLLNETTLLVGEYPSGTADGPQIEANLQYILANFTTPFGTPYKVVRIPMPPDGLGNFPDDWGDYRTYANHVFVNKTVLVPTYETQYDTTALRILRETMPGYQIIGINCNQIIQASGALHCITKEVGVNDPLLITHNALRDVDIVTAQSDPIEVRATIKHRTGIAEATLYYRTDTLQPYVPVSMTLANAGTGEWMGTIPPQLANKRVYYYIQATAYSGKKQARPMPAPAGYFSFWILGGLSGAETQTVTSQIKQIYPNPAKAITCIPVYFSSKTEGSLSVYNQLGQVAEEVHKGIFAKGDSNYFIDASKLQPGTYSVVLKTASSMQVQLLVVR
jgi:agmatine deiminase